MANPADAPLVTVITPTYNVEPYIGEAIDSALAQTDGRFEYLVIDDGSSDGTLDVVRSRMTGDGPIRLIECPHGGSAAARNAGLREARGRYIAFLDGDDRWDPNFLRSQLQLIKSLDGDVGAVFCRARVITTEGTVVGRRWQRGGRYDFDDMLVLNCPPRSGSSLLVRKSCFDEAGFFDEELRSGVDFDMWLRIGLRASAPIFWGSTEYLVDVRLRPGAISSDLDARFRHMGILLERFTPELRREQKGRAYIRPALLAFRAGQDDIAEGWMTEVRSADKRTILRDQFGLRALAWSALPRGARQALRLSKKVARRAVIAGAGRATGAAAKLRH